MVGRPILAEHQVFQLLAKYYGVHVKHVEELTAYDDRNYHVVSVNDDDDEYIFKVTNAKDTVKNYGFMQSQVELLNHLISEGFKVPKSVMSLSDDGSGQLLSCYVPLVKINGTQHAVRLFKYIKGDVWASKAPMGDDDTSSRLYTTVGEFCGALTVAMQKFPHKEMFCNYSCEWHLDKTWAAAKEYIADIPVVKQSTFTKIFNDFDDFVGAHMSTFERGLIHSDLNDTNILVDGGQVVGVIDFNEVTVSPLVFDLSIAVTEAITLAQNLMVGKYVLRGYLTKKSLPKMDLMILPYCIKVRLCSCLILSTHAATLDPSNSYLTKSLQSCWTILDELADTDIFTLWDYNVDSRTF